jgi:glycine betaine/proline transport system substrate-binding protein
MANHSIEETKEDHMLNNLLKTTLGVVIGAAILAGSVAMAADMPGKGKTAKGARATWDTFWFGGTVIQIGLEKLGYDVKAPKTLNNPARYPALAQGDIDYETDTVWPNVKAVVEKLKGDIEMVGPIMSPGSIQGYLVDRKTAEKHNITKVEDLKKADVIKLFDKDKDGKADLISCNPGWNCEKIITHHMKAYDLGSYVEQIQGEYNVLVGDTVARFKAGEPVLFYAWFPNTATVQMMPDRDVVWLQVDKTDLPSGVTNTTMKGVAGCAGGSTTCNTGWSATQYFISANKKWLADNPAARKLFEMVKMKLDDRVTQNIAMKNGEDSEADLRRHAEEWIKKNQAQFDKWLDMARAAK